MNGRRFVIGAATVLALGAIGGCGGSSAGVRTSTNTGGGGGLTGVQGNTPPSLATTFQVNLSTGQVTTIAPAGSQQGSALKRPGLFTGNSLGFNASVLTNNGLGGTGVRSLQVSITNNTDIPAGISPSGAATGLNVIFGGFANTTGITSQAPYTNVSTFAGSSAGYKNGPISVAQFSSASGMAIGPDGSLYVADYGNNVIRKISTGYVTTLAGTATAGEVDGVATRAMFNGPYGIAYNPVDGSLIVADYTGNTIRRVTSTGVVNTVAGTGTAGSANGAGSSATFTHPACVAVDPSGNIYVSEPTSCTIRKITLSGSPNTSADYTVTAFAGINGINGAADGTGSGATFYDPYGLCTDPSGNIYVADYENNKIRMIDPAAHVTTVAGSGSSSDLDGYGPTATFNRPIGVTYLNGALFVSESGGYVMREVVPVPGAPSTSAQGWAVMTLAGKANTHGDTNGAGNVALFGSLRFLAASQTSSLYVADFGNSQIRRINPSTGAFPIGTPIGTTGTDPVTLSNGTGIVADSELGQAPYINYPLSAPLNPGASTQAQNWNFVIPPGVTSFQFQVLVEAPTTEYLPLQSAVGAGSPNVDVRLYAGATGLGFADGVASQARFDIQDGLAVDGSGVVYIADSGNTAIRRIDTTGRTTTIAGVIGVGGGYADGLGTVAQFQNPTGMVVNPAGTEIILCDEYNQVIRIMELTGSNPADPASWTVSTIAGTAGTAGDGIGPGTTATFNYPDMITADPSGNLYVSEVSGGGNRIRELVFTGGSRTSPADWQVSTAAGNGTLGLSNGPAASAEFEGPAGMCCDAYGNLYIADYQDDVIRELNTSGTVTTFAGMPKTAGYADGQASSAQFRQPFGICIDSAGYLYVADLDNSLIRRISPAGTVSTVAGVVSQNAFVDGSGATAEFSKPMNVAVSSSGNLYVTSYSDATIRLVQTVINQASGSARSKAP